MSIYSAFHIRDARSPSLEYLPNSTSKIVMCSTMFLLHWITYKYIKKTNAIEQMLLKSLERLVTVFEIVLKL